MKRSDTYDRQVETGDMTIARDSESSIQYLDGDVYEVRRYYHAFDASEIEAITNARS